MKPRERYFKMLVDMRTVGLRLGSTYRAHKVEANIGVVTLYNDNLVATSMFMDRGYCVEVLNKRLLRR